MSSYYAEQGINADVQTFFNDMPNRLADAQLVIGRAGASTVADISVVGRPSILVPLAIAIRDEQTANARALVGAGAAVLIPEKHLQVATLTSHVAAILGQPDAASRMARAALSCGKPDATEALVALVTQLGTGTEG